MGIHPSLIQGHILFTLFSVVPTPCPKLSFIAHFLRVSCNFPGHLVQAPFTMCKETLQIGYTQLTSMEGLFSG